MTIGIETFQRCSRHGIRFPNGATCPGCDAEAREKRLRVTKFEGTSGLGGDEIETAYVTFEDNSKIELAWTADGDIQVIGFRGEKEMPVELVRMPDQSYILRFKAVPQ